MYLNIGKMCILNTFGINKEIENNNKLKEIGIIIN